MSSNRALNNLLAAMVASKLAKAAMAEEDDNDHGKPVEKQEENREERIARLKAAFRDYTDHSQVFAVGDLVRYKPSLGQPGVPFFTLGIVVDVAPVGIPLLPETSAQQQPYTATGALGPAQLAVGFLMDEDMEDGNDSNLTFGIHRLESCRLDRVSRDDGRCLNGMKNRFLCFTLTDMLKLYSSRDPDPSLPPPVMGWCHPFKQGDIVQWKPHMKVTSQPEYAQPCIVVSVFHPRMNNSDEKLDTVLGFLDTTDGQWLTYMFNSSRFVKISSGGAIDKVVSPAQQENGQDQG